MLKPCRRLWHLPAARRETQRLPMRGKYAALAQTEAMGLQVRLEDLTVWEMEKVKQSRKGTKKTLSVRYSSRSSGSAP